MKKRLLAARLAEINSKSPLRRDFVFDESAIDIEARTAECVAATETPVPRWFGLEILGCQPGELDTTRLNSGAPVLWMHDMMDQRGVVVPGSVRFENGEVRLKLRFAKDAEGEHLFQRVIDKICTKISVGYELTDGECIGEQDGQEIWRCKWSCYEVSVVSVPADNNSQIGRSFSPGTTVEKPQEERIQHKGDTQNVEVTESLLNQQRTFQTMEKTLRNAAGDLVRATVDANGAIVQVLEVLERAGADVASALSRGQDSERSRVRELSELGRAYNATEKAMQFIAEGKTPAELQRSLLEDFSKQNTNKPLEQEQRSASIGMTDKEIKTFSIFKAVRSMMDPQNKTLRDAAAFEFECSRAAAELYGKNPKGILIPGDVLASRTFGTGANGTSGNGGAAVATNLMAGSFIELLRNRTWVMKRARVMAGLVGNVDIPRQNATGQAYWVGEGGAPTASTPGLDQIQLSPKTVGAYTDITRRLMIQATPDAERMVRDDLLKVLALEIDRVAIYGSGSTNQPLGLKNVAGLPAQAFATPGKPTFEELVSMETKVALANADVGSMVYAANAGLRGYAKTALKFPGTAASGTIWEAGNTINGYSTEISNQIAAGEALFGNMDDFILGFWSGLELTVDPFALSTSGGLRLIALQDMDCAVRHKESFVYGA